MTGKYKKLVVVLYDRAVNHYRSNKLTEPFEKEFWSHLSLIRGLRKFFSDADLGFYTPDLLLSNSGVLSIGEEMFKPTGQELHADNLLVFTINNCSPHFSQGYVRAQREQYISLSEQVGQFLNPLSSWGCEDKKDMYLFGEQYFPELLDSSSWAAVEASMSERGSGVLKHRLGTCGDTVYLVTPENIEAIREKVGDSLSDHILQEKLDISSEKRLFVIDREVIAARIVYNRSNPWDGERWDHPENFGDQVRLNYVPSRQERDVAKKLSDFFDLDYAAVDVVDTNQGSLIMEANIFAPALKAISHPEPGVIYDLGETFAEYLYNTACGIESNCSLVAEGSAALNIR